MQQDLINAGSLINAGGFNLLYEWAFIRGFTGMTICAAGIAYFAFLISRLSTRVWAAAISNDRR